MNEKKVSYQTNFSGLKHSNNPLTADINSFSNANNVYLNKYNALISRPPLTNNDYPAAAYAKGLGGLIPLYLKIVGMYNNINNGEIYVVYNTNTNRYTFRYKDGYNYSDILDYDTWPQGEPEPVNNIASYDDFTIVEYKQYYILFSVDGAMVLDTNQSSGSWYPLEDYVDIPVTAIQTGNEILTLDGNELTDSYKKQFMIKPDSDDTIYALPVGEDADVVFPNISDTAYLLRAADEYTRLRLVRPLATPVNSASDGLVSMSGPNIAIAHADRVDISLDYGDTFKTIVYPTAASNDYKDTASLSEDGLNFFYVHTDGVYRYDLGTNDWTLISVVLEPSYDLTIGGPWENMSVEREAEGVAIASADVGANYGHFINANKFAFALAHYRASEADWITVVYTLGLEISNLFDQDLNMEITNKISSFATVLSGSTRTPFYIIPDIVEWTKYPYLNTRKSKILNNKVVAFYLRESSSASTGLILKQAPTHLRRAYSSTVLDTNIDYVAISTHLLTNIGEVNNVEVINTNTLQILAKRTALEPTLNTVVITYSATEYTSGLLRYYTIVLTAGIGTSTLLDNVTGSGNSPFMHKLDNSSYLHGDELLIVEDNALVANYSMSYIYVSLPNVVVSGANYLIWATGQNRWYTNIPALARFTYTYESDSKFTKVPAATFADQNLWLAMDKTLWIGNMIDNKLSVLPINSNLFSKAITAIIPMSSTSKAIFFTNSIVLGEQSELSDGSILWYYYPLKFTVGVRPNDSVISNNEGPLTIFPTKYGLAVLTYQLDVSTTEQAITYLTDDIKTVWADFYNASSKINIVHSNTQLIVTNGTNNMLIYDFRTGGWYPLTFPTKVKISRVQPSAANHEILSLQPLDAEITSLTSIYQFSKERDELYTYETPYKDFGTTVIPWNLTSQLLLLEAPNNYKNISQIMIDQVDSASLPQSAYLRAQIFRQRTNIVKPSMELIYDIETFAKIVKKVNWWKVLGLKWQLENDSGASYPTQLRLYNISINYDISYGVK